MSQDSLKVIIKIIFSLCRVTPLISKSFVTLPLEESSKWLFWSSSVYLQKSLILISR